MSQVELERLVTDVKANKDLQDEIKSIRPSNEAVVEWATAHGYDITIEELSEYIRERKAELTDEELDRVVGGKGLSYDWTVTNQQGVSHTYDPRQLAMIGHDMFIAHPMAAQIDAGWAGYKDTWASDKAKVQDSSPQGLIDAAQSYGATVGQSGGETDVTFADGARVTYDGQSDVNNGQPEGFTQVNLPGGGEVYHDFSVGSSGVHEGESTSISFSNGSEFHDVGGEKSFYSAPHEVNVAAEGKGEFSVSEPQGTSTFEVASSVGLTAYVTTDQGTTVHHVGLKEVEQGWAGRPSASAAWNDPGDQIVVENGWVLEHNAASGPETTFTTGRGTEYILPNAPTHDWTVTNSQGDYRTFTPEQIYHEEVNWLVAHPKVDHIPDDVASAKEIANAWPAEKATAKGDWDADKAAAVAAAQDPAVRTWEQAFDVAKEKGGGALPHGGTLQVDYSNGTTGYEIITPQGRKVSWGDGWATVWGPEQQDGNRMLVAQHNTVDVTESDPAWTINTRSGVGIELGRPWGPDTEDMVSKGGAAGLVYDANNPQEPWSIQTDWLSGPVWDGAEKMVSWGPGEVSIQSPDVTATLQVQDGHIDAVESEKVSIAPGSSDNFLAGPAGQFSIETIASESAPTLLVTSPYGERWTIAQGAPPVTQQPTEESLPDKAHPAAAFENDVTVEQKWYVSDSSGQVIAQSSSNRLRQDAENVETAHPQAVQEVKTWTADTETYETAKQGLESHPSDLHGLPEGTVSGSKGDVSYTFTPGVSGQSGYNLVIEGPDAYFHTTTVDYEGATSRWVGYDSDRTGKENDVFAVYSDGQVENLGVDEFSFARQEGSNYGEVSGPRGEFRYLTKYGRDDQQLDTQVALTDGADVTLTRDTMIQGHHGGFVERTEVPDADPIMNVQLRDETSISWQRSDESYYKSASALWEANLDFFVVSGAGGRELDWTPSGMTYYSSQTGPVAETPYGTPDIFDASFSGMLSGTGYAASLDSTPVSFQAPHGTVEIVPEWGYYRSFGPDIPGLNDSGNQVDYLKNGSELVMPLHPTDEEIVEFNDGLTLVHQPHFTEVYKGTYDQGQMVAESGQPVELLWVDGNLDQIAGQQIRPQGSFSKQAFGGRAVETIVPGASSSTGTLQESYTGVDGNVVTIGGDSSGGSTVTLDGAQLQRGQNETVMGPDGRISVEWDTPSSELPDGSDLSGSSSGFAVVGVHGDVQIVSTEQGGHSAWVIDNQRVISPYQYASQYITKVESGDGMPATVWTDQAVVTQLEVVNNEALAVDTTVAASAEVFAVGVVVLT